MSFRESIAYSHNLITGQKLEVIKKKPIIPVKGITTIEIFDDLTKKKIQEIKSENIINNRLSKYAFMEFYYERIKGSTTEGKYEAPFRYLLLTNFNGVEDAELKAPRGAIVGYAEKITPYSGTDILRGTINSVETKLDTDGTGLLHFVFDFPTSAANGTFQSLWWTQKYYYSLSYSELTISGTGGAKLIFSSSYTRGYVFLTTNNGKKLIVTYRDNSTLSSGLCYAVDCFILNDDFTVASQFILSSKISSSIYNQFCGVGVGDDSLILVNGYISTNNIAILNLTTGLVTYLSLATPDQRNVVQMVGSNLYLVRENIIKVYTVNGSTVTFVKDIPFASNTSNYVYFQVVDELPHFCGADGYGYKLENNNLLISNYYLVNGENRLDQSDPYSYLWSGKDIGVSYSSGEIKIKKYELINYVGAQNLLPEPITKTPTNTMKIQYDFQVQKVL